MNKKTKKRIINVIIVVCVLAMLYSIINIIMWCIAKNRNETITKEINEIINEPIKENSDESKIDFAKLREKNKEIVGYLKVNGTNINYVVVKGKDNNYYLNHNLYKEYSVFGSIFMDYRDKLNDADKNIIIYGHNTKDGSMFGSLKNILTKEWYEKEDNHVIELVLENKTLVYQVFSTYSIKAEDYYISTNFKNNNEFSKFVKKLKNRSKYNYDVDVTGEDNILTLSTCASNRVDRVVLHAKLIYPDV